MSDVETQSSAAAAAHDPYSALRVPSYRFYSLGWVIAVMGQQVQSAAIGWELYQRTGEAMALGWVGLVQAIPVIVLALPAGHLADQKDRRKIIMAGLSVSLLCSLGLAALSWMNGPILMFYGLLLLAATALAMAGPSRSALLPQIVPLESFSNAVTWNSSFFEISCMVGPAIGGLVLTFSVPMAYVVNAVCAAVFIILLTMLKTRPVQRKREPINLQTLAAGVRFVFSTKIILATITLDLFAVLLGGATYLLPIYATKILGVGAVGFGWLRAAPAAGAIIMAMILAHRPPLKNAGWAMLWAVGGFGIATIIFGLSRNYWLSLAALFLTGAFDNISVVVRHTLVQVLTPDSMRGRVTAVNSVFISSSNELGGFESGVTAQWFGPMVSVVAGGIGTVLVVLGVGLKWPQVRRFGSLRDARPGQETEE